MRPYQRSQRPGQNPRLVQVEFDMLHWNDPAMCPPCPPTGTVTCPPCPPQHPPLRPIGPHPDLPNEITNPPSTRLLEHQRDALQFFRWTFDQPAATYGENPPPPPFPSTGPQVRPNIFDSSRGMQPFNQDMMFAADLWFLHSAWTSFEKTKLVLRPLIDSFGMDSFMVQAYVPMDLKLLPST